MNPNSSHRLFSRPVIAIGAALIAAALMIVAAAVKRSFPAGSVSEDVLEGAIMCLAIVAVLVPYLALPVGRGKNGARQS